MCKRDFFSTLDKRVNLKHALISILFVLLVISMVGIGIGHYLRQEEKVDPGNKLQVYEKVVLQQPQDVEGLVRLGYLNLTENNYENALTYYQRAFDMAPDSPMVRFHMAIAYLAVEKYEESIALLEPLAADGALNFDAHLTLGHAYYMAGSYDRAVVSLSKAVLIMPGAANAHYLLGLCYEELGDREQALKCLGKALKMVPDYQEAQQAVVRLSSAN